MESLVFFLNSFDEIVEFVLKKFFDILLFDDFAGEGFLVVFVFVGLVGGGEGASPQALVHFNYEFAYFFIFLLHYQLYAL